MIPEIKDNTRKSQKFVTRIFCGIMESTRNQGPGSLWSLKYYTAHVREDDQPKLAGVPDDSNLTPGNGCFSNTLKKSFSLTQNIPQFEKSGYEVAYSSTEKPTSSPLKARIYP